MAADLFLILALRVDKDLRNQGSEDIFEVLQGEVHLRPVVTLFHNVQHIAYKKRNDTSIRVSYEEA